MPSIAQAPHSHAGATHRVVPGLGLAAVGVLAALGIAALCLLYTSPSPRDRG